MTDPTAHDLELEIEKDTEALLHLHSTGTTGAAHEPVVAAAPVAPAPAPPVLTVATLAAVIEASAAPPAPPPVHAPWGVDANGVPRVPRPDPTSDPGVGNQTGDQTQITHRGH